MTDSALTAEQQQRLTSEKARQENERHAASLVPMPSFSFASLIFSSSYFSLFFPWFCRLSLLFYPFLKLFCVKSVVYLALQFIYTCVLLSLTLFHCVCQTRACLSSTISLLKSSSHFSFFSRCLFGPCEFSQSLTTSRSTRYNVSSLNIL